MSSPPPPGIYVPAVLFFTPDEQFDEPAIVAHILRLANAGVTGIVVQGSNGEAQHLDHAERAYAIRLTRTTLDNAGFNDVVIIAGCGAQSARETKVLCSEAKEAGAGFVLVLTPSTWPAQMTPDAILSFHRECASSSPVPYLVYNYPTVTAGLDLSSDIILALSTHPNIVGTKLSCGNLGKLARLVAALPTAEFATLAGTSEILLPALLLGGAGAIAALPNVVPRLHMRLLELVNTYRTLGPEVSAPEARKTLDEAFALQSLLSQGDWATARVGGIGGIKAIVSRAWGYGSTVVRLPLRSPPDNIFEVESAHALVLEKLVEMEKAA